MRLEARPQPGLQNGLWKGQDQGPLLPAVLRLPIHIRPFPRGPCFLIISEVPGDKASFRQGVPFWLRQNLHLNGPSQVPDATHVLSPLLPQVSMSVYGTFAQLVLLLALSADTSVLWLLLLRDSGPTGTSLPSPFSWGCIVCLLIL